MAAYLLRRTAVSVVVLIGISMIVFLLLHLFYPSPGLDVLGIGARPVQVAAWNRDHGFTQPVVVQYWHYVDRLLHGDLGYCYKLNQIIASLFEERWARSLYLSGTSLALALLATIALGSYQAVRRRRLGDRVATGLEYTLYAMPDYVLYLLAIQVRVFPLFPGVRAGHPGAGLHQGDTGQGPARTPGAVPAPAPQRLPADDYPDRAVDPGAASRQPDRGDGLQLRRPRHAVQHQPQQ